MNNGSILQRRKSRPLRLILDNPVVGARTGSIVVLHESKEQRRTFGRLIRRRKQGNIAIYELRAEKKIVPLRMRRLHEAAR